MNYPDIVGDRLPPAGNGNKNRCIFTGGIAPNRGILQVLAALALLKDGGLKVTLELAGSITDDYLLDLMREADRLEIRDQVHYLGLLSRSQAITLQHRGGIGLVPHLPYGNNQKTLSIKMFEFMAAGIPLVYSDLPNHREIAGTAGIGIPVDPTKPVQIADAIGRLVNDPSLARQMGEAGSHTVREKYNWNVERSQAS